MVTNLRNKIINPITVSLMIIVITIVTAINLNDIYRIRETAEVEYYKSKSFMKSLVDLTTYLKQTKLEGKPLNDLRYESLDNLRYYIEKDGKIVTNYDIDEDINTSLQTSKFYMTIEFNSNNGFIVKNSNLDEGFSEAVFQTTLNSIIYRGKVTRKDKSLGYENLKVYYFIQDRDITLNTDYIGKNVERYREKICLKIAVGFQVILMIGFAVYIIFTYHRNKLKGKVWYVLSKVNSELKIIGFLLGLKVAKDIYIKINQGYILSELSFMYRYIFIGTYVIGSILAIIIMAWYIIDILSLCQKGGKERFKEHSFLIKYQKQIKKVVSSIGGFIYGVIDINPEKPSYIKLVILNIIHSIALVFLAVLSYSDATDGLTCGSIYVAIGTVGALSYAWDFKRMCKVIEERKGQCKISFSYAKMCSGLIGYAIALFMLVLISDGNDEAGIITACIIGITGLIFSFIYVRRYQEFYEYVIGMRDDIQYTKPAKSFLSPIIEELEHMNVDFQNAVKQEVISQRMKTELISNVSHDLKTPLTSIISYIDLLKDENLSKEKQQEYIAILDQKSQRLKILIEDLFEASKAASGNMELITEEIDVVALMKQTLGELEEKINRSNLQFKINMPEEKVICNLDGRRTYRIFENLIGNALKYSAPYSRVYIDIQAGEEVSIIFKNMSAYEMNFTAEEITERFKRGDESRHTEGSGLGLAIAKSLTELQDGRLEIFIDGDLFKVIVKFKGII